MKTNLVTIALFALNSVIFAQDRTTVNAMSSEISDNLDLRAVASTFGDSKNLEDFERRLNDPNLQLSNLDLNNDNQVDYLRVIETIEGNDHIIVLQDIIGKDQYQDVATIEVQRDNRNGVQVQVVGDVYMYGSNYIYEPVYNFIPAICTTFWSPAYRPYYSNWYWNYYPNYYYAWNPFPIFRYRHHIGLCINMNYQYNYVNYRRCQLGYNDYYNRRSNYYERQYPNYAFGYRHENIGNRYDLDQTRPHHNEVAYNNPRNYSPRTNGGYENSTPRNYITPRENNTPRVNENNATNSPRIYNTPRTQSQPETNGAQNNNPRSYNTPRQNDNPQFSPRNSGYSTPPRSAEPRAMGNMSGGSSPREMSAPRGGGNGNGGGRGSGRR